MRGWVYVITNKSMPDFLKVGFTLKDPNLRARELNSTGLPHSYVVEYEVFVEHPRHCEQKAHTLLKEYREGKEWFNCSLAHAISVIQKVAGTNSIFETPRSSIGEPKHNKTSDAPEKTNQLERPNIIYKRTAGYSGACNKCKTVFSVTLTRHDTTVRCPSCLGINQIYGVNW